MVEPPVPPHRERWLHVVRDGQAEPAAVDDQPGPEEPEAGAGNPLPPVFTRSPPNRGTTGSSAQPDQRRAGAGPPPSPVPRRWRRRVGWAWVGAAVGTAVATVVDRGVGGLDGHPALFLLVVLTLPFWDGLPARVSTRLVELGAVGVAVAVLWLALAALRPEGWWRAEIAYGIGCGIAGTAHALLSRRRTVEP